MSESLISTLIEKQHFYIDKHMVFIYLKLLCWYLLYQHTAPMTMTTTSRMNTPTPTTIPVLIYNNNEGLIKVIIDYFTSLKTLIIFSKENFKHFWSITHKIRKHTYRKKKLRHWKFDIPHISYLEISNCIFTKGIFQILCKIQFLKSWYDFVFDPIISVIA